MTKKVESTFDKGDFVVYPTHGVGRILGTETRDVGGSALEMLVVRFEHDRMTLRVPLEKARSLGLRTLSSKKADGAGHNNAAGQGAGAPDHVVTPRAGI
jgi:CarD family transcriptional regulator